MGGMQFIHLIAAGTWAGSIAAEAMLEITSDQAKPHARRVRILAIPAILVALFTGIAMLHQATWDALLVVKVALAAVAMLLHAVAAFTARRQRQCLDAHDMAGHERFNRWRERLGIGCMVCLAGAAAIGGLRMAE